MKILELVNLLNCERIIYVWGQRIIIFLRKKLFSKIALN